MDSPWKLYYNYLYCQHATLNIYIHCHGVVIALGRIE